MRKGRPSGRPFHFRSTSRDRDRRRRAGAPRRGPNEIINKPGKLTADERKVIEMHTVEGERMLHRVGGLLGEIGRIVRSCHENYDGSGYPDGLARDEIPLLARIVSCCDAFNAMTSDRSYRKAMPLEDAIAELRRVRGAQFDPQVVDALIEAVGDGVVEAQIENVA
jgi:HD-GYP domain-containing protein (c-di-GMP phosphodiesterase class II)